jgi:hypothetical protein
MIFVLSAVFFCVFAGGCVELVSFERQVQLSAQAEAGGSLKAQTHNGRIGVGGVEGLQCDVLATITGRAVTVEKAEELARKVAVRLVGSGKNLFVKIEIPKNIRNGGVCVDLDMTVPNETTLDLGTHNGKVKVESIVGGVKVVTHNGSIRGEGIDGDVNLKTHNGSIKCYDVLGDVRAVTHNGSVDVRLDAEIGPVVNADIHTHNGGVSLTGAGGLSAMVEISTHNGHIETKVPITVVGKISKNSLHGKIGDGEGKIRLRTSNGSVKLH